MRWKHKINIRKYLDEGTPLQAAADGIRKEVEKIPLVDVPYLILADLDEAAKIGKVEWFDATLDRLWDWFDEERIWCEL